MREKQRFQALFAALLVWTSLCALAPAARAQAPQSAASLPGAQLWQPYLDESPVSVREAAQDPLALVRAVLGNSLPDVLQSTLRRYASTLLFLLLAAAVSFFAADALDGGLLDLVAAGGCGVLLWSGLVDLAEAFCEQISEWERFLLGFLPVYAGVLSLGGETAAGSAASGFLLTALCALAQVLNAVALPLLQCYLALSMACCISTESALGVACRAVGRLMVRGLAWAGRLLIALLSLQRVSAWQLDRATLRAGRLLAGTVPIIGQTLSDASESILSAVQMLKSGLGLAAILTLTAEFLPVYLGLLCHLALLSGCSVLCGLTGTPRCQKLLECFAEAVRCMAAATALFFGIAVFGTAILFFVGGG